MSSENNNTENNNIENNNTENNNIENNNTENNNTKNNNIQNNNIENEDVQNEDVQDDNIVDFKIGEVKDIQQCLGNNDYLTVRKSLYKKYGLITKEEKSMPNYYMITYGKTNKIPEEYKSLINKYRGIILEKNTNKPVCYTFEKMNRHLPDDWKLDDCKITLSYDGSQIKLFYNGKNWVISTTRKIDASKAFYFGKKSFLDMFKEASGTLDYNKLDKKNCYAFVLSHPENRIVARHNNPCIVHVLTRNMETFELVDEYIGIKKPNVIEFKSKEDIWKTIRELPHYREGYVIQKGDKFIKIVNKKYREIKNLRGYSHSKIQQYIDLKKNKKIRIFLQYYPESSEIFRTIEKKFNNLCIMIYNEYIMYRIRKVLSYKNTIYQFRQIMYKIHGYHLINKKKINMNNVINIIENLPSFYIKKLIEYTDTLTYSFV